MSYGLGRFDWVAVDSPNFADKVAKKLDNIVSKARQSIAYGLPQTDFQSDDNLGIISSTITGNPLLQQYIAQQFALEIFQRDKTKLNVHEFGSIFRSYLLEVGLKKLHPTSLTLEDAPSELNPNIQVQLKEFLHSNKISKEHANFLENYLDKIEDLQPNQVFSQLNKLFSQGLNKLAEDWNKVAPTVAMNGYRVMDEAVTNPVFWNFQDADVSFNSGDYQPNKDNISFISDESSDSEDSRSMEDSAYHGYDNIPELLTEEVAEKLQDLLQKTTLNPEQDISLRVYLASINDLQPEQVEGHFIFFMKLEEEEAANNLAINPDFDPHSWGWDWEESDAEIDANTKFLPQQITPDATLAPACKPLGACEEFLNEKKIEDIEF